MLKALAATPGDLERMVRGMDDTAVTHSPMPDHWSIADVLCHLHMVEGHYLARLQQVTTETRPSIPAIHPHPAAHDLTLPAITMLANFRQARQATSTFLQERKAGDWQRTAVHPTWGEVKFRALVQHLVDHDTNHLNQIVEIQHLVKKGLHER